MEFKGTEVFPKYEGGDNTSIDMIFESGAVISIDRRDRYSDKLVMSREEMEANAKLISTAPEMLKMLKQNQTLIDKLSSANLITPDFMNECYNVLSENQKLISKATTI